MILIADQNKNIFLIRNTVKDIYFIKIISTYQRNVDGSVKQLFHNFLLVGLVHIDNDVNIGFIVGCKLGYLSADTIGGYYRY